MTRRFPIQTIAWIATVFLLRLPIGSADELRPADVRFASDLADEVPDFQRHVLPLLGRLGCNGRTCHGSFQGQGGFRLSLFGYDVPADHRAISEGEPSRVDRERPAESPLLWKPTHPDDHGGGLRMEIDSWSYRLLYRWIANGGEQLAEVDRRLTGLEILPSEVVFQRSGESIALRVIARWSDGIQEDVTPLCRYQVNNDAIAKVDDEGRLTSLGPGDSHAVAFYDSGVAVAGIIHPVSSSLAEARSPIARESMVDDLVRAKLSKMRIVSSELCGDEEFLRRVSLDVTGTLPSPREIETFRADPSPAKREKKIDELLERPTYVARWTTKLCDITGNSPKHFKDQAPPEEYARDWYAWIARRVSENIPYDELMAGIAMGRSRQAGQSYREYIAEQSAYYHREERLDFAARSTMPYYWAKHNMRTPEERALNFSYVFLGVRIECAQCHKHPFDRWTQDDFKAFTAIFQSIGFGVPPDDRKLHQAMLKELNDSGNQAQRERARLLRAQRGEIVPWQEVFLAPPGTRVEGGKLVKSNADIQGRVLGGEALPIEPSEDPRRGLVEWMRSDDNPYFARSFVNRVWAEYFGVGIIDPTDDLNQANPPSNAPLLNYLVDGFVSHRFDMKWLHGEITKSQTYQRSMRVNDSNRYDERNFSRALPRRLSAPILFDAILQATASSDQLAKSAVDVEERAIGPKGGAFVGRWGENEYASRVFGRSSREAICDCSASNEPNLLQAIYMQNDKDLWGAIDRKQGWLHQVRLELSANRGREKGSSIDSIVLVTEAFLRTLSRPPTPQELDRGLAYLENSPQTVDGLRDLLWVLLNMREFITNH